MRLTQALLVEYLELERRELALQERREEIRAAILADGRKSIRMGSFEAAVLKGTKIVIKPRERVVQLIGPEMARKIYRRTTFTKVCVRKRK